MDGIMVVNDARCGTWGRRGKKEEKNPKAITQHHDYLPN